MANVVNPYSFVPLGTAPVRTSLDACYTGPLLTGRLDYTLTTDTPLLIPDTAKTVQDEQVEDHKRYPFFRLPDGTPTIPGSELRGAMRGVYEAVTNSCLVRAAGQHGGTVQPASALDERLQGPRPAGHRPGDGRVGAVCGGCGGLPQTVRGPRRLPHAQRLAELVRS